MKTQRFDCQHFRPLIKPHHRANLRRLADYVDQQSKNNTLPCEFGMSSFACLFSDGERFFYEPMDFAVEREVNCRTVACFAGFGPLAGIMPNYYEPWTDYVYRVFGLMFESDDVAISRGWLWIFLAEWAYYDNSAAGAVWRTRYLLEHGVPIGSVLYKSFEPAYGQHIDVCDV